MPLAAIKDGIAKRELKNLAQSLEKHTCYFAFSVNA